MKSYQRGGAKNSHSLEEKSFENVDRRGMPTYTLSSPISLRLRCAKRNVYPKADRKVAQPQLNDFSKQFHVYMTSRHRL